MADDEDPSARDHHAARAASEDAYVSTSLPDRAYGFTAGDVAACLSVQPTPVGSIGSVGQRNAIAPALVTGLPVASSITTFRETPMPKVSLRRLLSKLTALALTTSAVAPAAADAMERDTTRELDDLDCDAPIDREQVAAEDAGLALGRSLALALAELRPLEATQLAATWSLSEDPVRRLAVAHALGWSFRLVGDAAAIDHLSRDADPAIRAAAARAAWVRRMHGGDPGVLRRLADDPDPRVRAIAAVAK